MYNTLISPSLPSAMSLVRSIESEFGCMVSITLNHLSVEAVAWRTDTKTPKNILRMVTPIFIKDVEHGGHPLLDILEAVKLAIQREFWQTHTPTVALRRIYVRDGWEMEMNPVPESLPDANNATVRINDFIDITPPPETEEWVLRCLPAERPFRAMIKSFTRDGKARVVFGGSELEVAPDCFVKASP